MTRRISIARLMVLVAIIAIGIATLRSPSRLGASVVFSLATGSIVVALLIACAVRTPTRLAALGYAIAATAYFSLTLVPGVDSRFGRKLVTSAVIDFVYERAEVRSQNENLLFEYGTQGQTGTPWQPHGYNFWSPYLYWLDERNLFNATTGGDQFRVGDLKLGSRHQVIYETAHGLFAILGRPGGLVLLQRAPSPRRESQPSSTLPDGLAMIFRDNPVLMRELLVNLRSPRAFVLQFVYVAFLGVMVYFAWPANESQVSSGAAQRLFDLFFLGQFFLVALVAPTFAAGSITGEKERKTYEMLLASPLQPTSILVGKLLSSLTYLVILIISSLPLIILCFLLGGILLSEIARAYLILILAAGTFGLLSLACSSYFGRTSSALVVSYLVILPLAIVCVSLTRTSDTVLRDFVSIAVLPPWCFATWAVVVIALNRRLLRPPDVGSEGKEVVDEEQEMKYAIGVVIDRDLFPDKLFAPAKRTDLMPDGTNPVLDKELRSEIFSQGTLMLRVVIQVSMLLSIPLMAMLLFLRPENAGYYVSYVLTFNLLVGPVFSAGSITQERERQTLNLLLTTLLRPGKIVFAKLIAALRVSTVLTFLLTETACARLYLDPRIARSGLDVRDLHPHHRDDLPGDVDDRTPLFGPLAEDVGGDDPHVHGSPVPVRRPRGGSAGTCRGSLAGSRRIGSRRSPCRAPFPPRSASRCVRPSSAPRRPPRPT